jgi:hypothetical protein
MKIKRRFPNFFSGFEETEHEVNTKEELLALPWIKAYDKIPNHMGVYYAPNDSKFEPAPDYLISLTRGVSGKVIYFVVGYIYGDGKELGLEDYKNFL